MMVTRMISMLAAAVLSSAALAAPAPVQRLSPAQVDQVLADAAARREAAEKAAPKALDIHGEVGVEVGTGGSRAAYGTALVPLGQDGAAIVSFSTSTERNTYRRRHH